MTESGLLVAVRDRARCVFKMCSEEIEPLSPLNDAPAFSVGYSRYPSALRHSLVVHHLLIYILVSFYRYVANISRLAFSLLFNIYVLRKVGIGTILELSCTKWEFSLCCAIPEW